MAFSSKTLATGGVLGMAALMVGSFAIAAKTRPAARSRRDNYPAATINQPAKKPIGIDLDGTNLKLGQIQKRATQSASRMVQAGRKRRT